MSESGSFGGSHYQSLVRDANLYELEIFEGEDFLGVNEIVDNVYTYWLNKCRDGRLPRRSDIRPEELRSALPYLVIMDVDQQSESEEEFSLIVRLIGTHVAVYYGELTGREISDMGNANAVERIYRLSRLVLDRRRSVFATVRGIAPGHEHLRSFALYTPLRAEDGDKIVKILVCAVIELSGGSD